MWKGGDGVSVKVKVSYESGKDLERLKKEKLRRITTELPIETINSLNTLQLKKLLIVT